MSEMLVAKRATRGLRMTSLIGDAAEQDETFWGDGIWGESDDESFSEVEVEPDQFDSDFNDTEDDGDNSEDEEKVAKKAEEAEKSGGAGTGNKYKEPAAKRSRPKVGEKKNSREATNGAAHEVSDRAVNSANKKSKVKKERSDDPATTFNEAREIRQSTKEKTVDSDVARQKTSKMKVKSRPPLRHQFSQRELLLDALITETENQKWLEAQKLADYERAVGDKQQKGPSTETYIRTISRRGTYNTVTFSDTECMPSILLGKSSIGEPQSQICVITGLHARYKDRLTAQPYATKEAFKEIRRQYAEFQRSQKEHQQIRRR